MRWTHKYAAATACADSEGIKVREMTDSEALYQELSQRGYQWDSKKGRWLYAPPEAADPPSKLVRIRVWAEQGEVRAMALLVAEALGAHGLELIEQSEPYPCRPPKQAESRVYLTFMRVEEDTYALDDSTDG